MRELSLDEIEVVSGGNPFAVPAGAFAVGAVGGATSYIWSHANSSDGGGGASAGGFLAATFGGGAAATAAVYGWWGTLGGAVIGAAAAGASSHLDNVGNAGSNPGHNSHPNFHNFHHHGHHHSSHGQGVSGNWQSGHSVIVLGGYQGEPRPSENTRQAHM